MRLREATTGVLLGYASLAASALASGAHAQVCHVGGPGGSDGFAASLQFREATVRDGTLQANYQGTLLGAGYALHPVELSLLIPAYRLDSGAGAQMGLADLLVDARLALWSALPIREHGDRVQAGVELAATLPTGDDEVGLGTGHVMVMPGLFLRATDEGAALLAQVGYGKALFQGGHAAHAGQRPVRDDHAGPTGSAMGSLVDPMSDSEVAASFMFSASATERFGLDASIAVAAPVAAEAGAARGTAGLGMHARLGAVTPWVMIEVPWLGAPFTHRLTLAVVVTFLSARTPDRVPPSPLVQHQ